MRTPTPLHRQTGFSLIEIMVGLVIGMATVVIMLQMLSNAEASKRITAGGNDAQTNSTMALYTLERDIRASGYGISSFSILGCNLSYTPSSESSPVTIPMATTTIYPSDATPASTIVPPGDAHTDTLLIMYGTADGSSEGDPLITTSSPGNYQVATPSAITLGNNYIGTYLVSQTAVRPSPCSLTIDTVTAVSGSMVSVTPGVSGLPVGSIIFNLGNKPVIHAYAIRNGTLTMCDYMVNNCGNGAYTADSTVWVPVASNIVGLHAQYGHDNSNVGSTMTGVVGTYDQITPGSPADKSGQPIYCSLARTMSVRLAVVARSNTYDKNAPLANTPTWSGSTVVSNSSSPPTNPTAVTFDLSGGNANWQQYRYKTLETTVPLRNAIWQGGQTTYQGGSGC